MLLRSCWLLAWFAVLLFAGCSSKPSEMTPEEQVEAAAEAVREILDMLDGNPDCEDVGPKAKAWNEEHGPLAHAIEQNGLAERVGESVHIDMEASRRIRGLSMLCDDSEIKTMMAKGRTMARPTRPQSISQLRNTPRHQGARPRTPTSQPPTQVRATAGPLTQIGFLIGAAPGLIFFLVAGWGAFRRRPRVPLIIASAGGLLVFTLQWVELFAALDAMTIAATRGAAAMQVAMDEAMARGVGMSFGRLVGWLGVVYGFVAFMRRGSEGPGGMGHGVPRAAPRQTAATGAVPEGSPPAAPRQTPVPAGVPRQTPVPAGVPRQTPVPGVVRHAGQRPSPAPGQHGHPSAQQPPERRPTPGEGGYAMHSGAGPQPAPRGPLSPQPLRRDETNAPQRGDTPERPPTLGPPEIELPD